MTRIDLDGSPENKGHVFVYDEKGNLRLKMWFYGNGLVTYRQWWEYGKPVTDFDKPLTDSGEYILNHIQSLEEWLQSSNQTMKEEDA